MTQDGGFKRLSRAVIKYTRPIRIRLGPDKLIEITKSGPDYYLVESEHASDPDLAKSPGSIPLLDGAILIIGRREISVQCLNLPDSISRHHMLLRREGEAFLLVDLHSKNGTYVDTGEC